jgi:hypothetical protein
MVFYIAMARKYKLGLYRTTAESEPGEIVYEDGYQSAVVNSLHGGVGFQTEKEPSR